MKNVVYRGTTWENFTSQGCLIICPKISEPSFTHNNCTPDPIIATAFSLLHFKDAADRREQHLPVVLCMDGKYTTKSNPAVSGVPLSKMLIINPFVNHGIDRLVGLVKKHPHPLLTEEISKLYDNHLDAYLAYFREVHRHCAEKFRETLDILRA